MMSQSGFRTRTPKKQNRLISLLRERILSGAWPAGKQLPIRTELEREFNISSATLQRALDQLRREGFIFARGSSGTFVSPHPPNTSHYGLILPLARYPVNDHFWPSLEAAAAAIEQKRPDLKIPVFTNGVDFSSNPETARLLKTVEEGRLAALIFGSSYPAYQRNRVLMETPLPKVCICSGRHAVPSVTFDYEQWLIRALDLLIAKGRRRIAVLIYSDLAVTSGFLPFWLDLLKKRNAVGGEHWWIGLHLNRPLLTQCMMKLLMRGPVKDRPDGLIVLNENFTDAALGALMQCGITIPNDVDIVSHCNFPAREPGGIPIERLGFTIPGLLETCIDLVEAQMKGKTPPMRTSVKPVTEAEYLARAEREDPSFP